MRYRYLIHANRFVVIEFISLFTNEGSQELQPQDKLMCGVKS
jgi:hypothetical protein